MSINPGLVIIEQQHTTISIPLGILSMYFRKPSLTHYGKWTGMVLHLQKQIAIGLCMMRSLIMLMVVMKMSYCTRSLEISNVMKYKILIQAIARI